MGKMRLMSESIRTWLMRVLFFLHPAYRGTGGKVIYISSDWGEVRVEIPLNWRTRNYVGTIFGGSMYAAIDPIFMLMLIKRLGPEFIVWDKEALIRFKKPGKRKLFAKFLISDQEIETIRHELDLQRSIDRMYLVELVDEDGNVIAEIEKKIYLRRK